MPLCHVIETFTNLGVRASFWGGHYSAHKSHNRLEFQGCCPPSPSARGMLGGSGKLGVLLFTVPTWWRCACNLKHTPYQGPGKSHPRALSSQDKHPWLGLTPAQPGALESFCCYHWSPLIFYLVIFSISLISFGMFFISDIVVFCFKSLVWVFWNIFHISNWFFECMDWVTMTVLISFSANSNMCVSSGLVSTDGSFSSSMHNHYPVA